MEEEVEGVQKEVKLGQKGDEESLWRGLNGERKEEQMKVVSEEVEKQEGVVEEQKVGEDDGMEQIKLEL